MEKHINIICFTIPFPVDYGGVVDLFWKLPALQNEGIKIHLHCFKYSREIQTELNKYCETVTYYKRTNSLLALFSNKPFIVATRSNKNLLKNLLQNTYPIICEGIHSTFLLTNKKFNNIKIIVRLHNVENEYYQHLHNTATHFYKKIFYKREANLLEKYEQKIATSNCEIVTVTQQDATNYATHFGCMSAQYLPLFIPNNWKVNIKKELGSYCLYNGDLSIDANEKAVVWLIKNVINHLENILFIVAGKKPSNTIKQLIATQKNVELIANPLQNKMEELIAAAQINILPSFSSAGIKLKLLNALYNGKFCIANNQTLSGSGLNSLCIVANTATEFIDAIKNNFEKIITNEMIDERKRVLNNLFDNKKNATTLIQLLFENSVSNKA